MSLCLSCGLCCDGTMFRVVKLHEGEAERLRSRVKLTEDKSHIPQRCSALRGDLCCGVYEDRPKICRAFRCLALAGLDSGRMTAAESQELIDETLGRRRALADAYGIDDVHEAVARARREDEAGTLSGEAEVALSRLRRALLVLQLRPDDPILGQRG
ncbi:MAG: YkgJ family cysteine cluster protein [Archangium sp.]